MNYYNRHIGDYLKDTSHLTLLEHGIYTRLMDVYYVRESALPQDQIARLVGARTNEELASLQSVLTEFFELVSGSWVQHRCEKEIEAYSDKSIKAKRSASARWERKETNTECTTDAMPTHSECTTDAMLPITNNQEPITNKKNTSAVAPPDGVVESVWTDFVELRKNKKAKLTQTALDGIEREAHRAGWSLENALRECCSRGWAGFKADWVSDKPRQSETFAERDARNARKRWEEMTGQVHPDNLPKSFEVFDDHLMLGVSQ
jgi:uncharacterized protein YdaU (DUF1376 family)